MKLEKYIFIALISLLIITLGIVFTKRYNEYKKMSELAEQPFASISILNNEISLANKKRKYELTIDCSNLVDENTQIISYKLKDNNKNALISTQTTIINENQQIIEEDYSDISELKTIITITDKDKTYEQIFYINTICE